MAVAQMQLVHIYGLKKQKKPLMKWLQRQGNIEIIDLPTDDTYFYKEDVLKNKATAERCGALAEDTIGILETYVPSKRKPLAFFEGKRELKAEDYEAFEAQYEELKKKVEDIQYAVKQLEALKAEKLQLLHKQEMFSQWESLDIPLAFKGTQKIVSFIGTLPAVWSEETLKAQLGEEQLLYIQCIQTDKQQSYFFILGLKYQEEQVLEKLRGLGFTYPDSQLKGIPKQEIEAITEAIKINEEAVERTVENIKSYAALRDRMALLVDYEKMKVGRYEATAQLLESDQMMILRGYIPKDTSPFFEKQIKMQFQVAVEFDEPSEEAEVPVLLKNNSFVAPLESVVEAFSPPGKGEKDPTTITALFYYVLFGLMLSDVAYGTMMVLGCGFVLWKYKEKLEIGMKNALKMFFICGISTIFWGAMFGSYFGDIVDVASQTFIGHKVIIPPLWFFPVNEPMRMLVFSMLVGVIHLLTGLTMKLIGLAGQKNYKAILYDVVFWYGIIVGCIGILLSTPMFTNMIGISFTWPEAVGRGMSILAILCAVGIVVTNGRESRNPFKRLLKGAYALYGITGYLSDVLSYSRLLALGLATGVICTVINKMASMAAVGPLGMVWFILIFLAGHSLNLGINLLGAYVHTTRLQYVEFFGKFYEGGGRKFMPYKLHTKYYTFKDSTYKTNN
ncbi:MAG: V-type ATP synthase subunit I [Cellulosilyticaceae bacterium]